MSIRKAGPDKWVLDIRCWQDGKEHRKREKFTGTERAAKNRYAALQTDLQRGVKETRSLKKSIQFKNIVSDYVEQVDIDPASRTYLDRLQSDLGTVEVADLRDRFEQYFALLRRTKSKHTGRTYSNQTVNHYIKWASAALNFALARGIIESNPIAHVRKLKTVPRDRILSEQEKRVLMATIERCCPHLVPITTFAMQVPSRTGELVSLRKNDVDLINNAVRCRHETAKGDRGSWKPIPADMVEYFGIFQKKQNMFSSGLRPESIIPLETSTKPSGVHVMKLGWGTGAFMICATSRALKH